jgi:hypothetical protein
MAVVAGSAFGAAMYDDIVTVGTRCSQSDPLKNTIGALDVSATSNPNQSANRALA